MGFQSQNKHFSIKTTTQNLGKITSETTFDHSKVVFWPFYVQKEFLRKIPSLPDFDFQDSDNTQTVILENIIRSSRTFSISGGYLRTAVGWNETIQLIKGSVILLFFSVLFCIF